MHLSRQANEDVRLNITTDTLRIATSAGGLSQSLRGCMVDNQSPVYYLMGWSLPVPLCAYAPRSLNEVMRRPTEAVISESHFRPVATFSTAAPSFGICTGCMLSLRVLIAGPGATPHPSSPGKDRLGEDPMSGSYNIGAGCDMTDFLDRIMYL